MFKIIKSNHQAVFLCLLFFLFLFTSTKVSAAGLVPCGLGTSDPCTLCHFIVGIKSLIDWGMGILIALSVTAISIAGVIYVVSSGDSELTKKAKSFVTSTVIGFALMLGAWLIINTTLWLFSAKKGGDGSYNLGLESKSWNSFSCSTASSTMGTLPPTGEEPISGYNSANFTFQSGIEAQAGDASAALQTLIVCMRNKLGSKMTINSISDSAGLQTCISSYAKPPCAHTKSSCHYGGTAPASPPKSEAVDISTTTGLTVLNIEAAANQCGAGFTQDESKTANHVHVSTTSCRKE
jgi:hypothetical protein